jgi:hypothetical protein
MEIIEKVLDGTKTGIQTCPANNSSRITVNENGIPGDSDSDNDSDSDDNEDEVGTDNLQGRGKVLENRRKWALIHFYALRPAFSISLMLYLASLTSGRGALTFRSGVVDPIRNLATLVQMESKAYTRCVRQSTERTAKRLEQLARDDQQSAKELLESNRKTLQRAGEAANKCLRNTQKARESLVQWRKDGNDITWKEVKDIGDGNASFVLSQNNNCTVKRRNQTEQLLGQDYHAAENQVDNALQNYMSDSHDSLKAVSDYAIERFDYDWDYFITGRIQPALDYLAERSVSIQTVGIGLSVNITEIEQMIEEQILAIQQVLEQAKQHIDILQEKLEDFRSTINGLYVNYNELYNRMAKATEAVIEFLPPGVPLPDIFDLSDLRLADSFLPSSGLVWPELDVEYADIQQQFRDTAKACSIILIQVLDDAQVQSLRELRGTIQHLAQTLMEILELKNYSPPQFQGSLDGILDIDHELEFQSLRGQEALNWTTQAMADLRAPSSVFYNLTIDRAETPTIGDFDYDYAEETSTTFELLDIVMPEFSFLEYVLSKVAILGDYAFLLDIIFGLFQWWKLSTMYESGAIPNMPQIDYGDGDGNQDSSGRPRTNYKILLFVAKSFLNPVFVGFLCISSFIAFLVITFWIPHVQQMCVHSTNGTWFANNMIGPALTNIAMSEGNAQYLLAEHICYSSQNQLCMRIGMEIETQLFTDKTALADFQAQHNHSLESLELLEECVDTSNVTKMVTESCCGLKGYRTVDCFSELNYTCPIDFSTTPPSAYRPLATYLESSSCSEQIHEWTLKDEQHECTNLKEACYDIPCDGVDDEWMQRVTNQTDCKVELWIIDFCRFWAVVIIHFIALYITCSLIYLGRRDLNWRKISPESIGLRTQLLENGDLVKGNKLEERSEKIVNEVKWFERKARLQVSLGALLVSVYTVVCLTLIVKR